MHAEGAVFLDAGCFNVLRPDEVKRLCGAVFTPMEEVDFCLWTELLAKKLVTNTNGTRSYFWVARLRDCRHVPASLFWLIARIEHYNGVISCVDNGVTDSLGTRIQR